MLEYIDNSGGRDYPFFRKGRVLRVASKEDMDTQAGLEQLKNELRLEARAIVERIGLPCRVVDVEPILGGETLTYYYTSEDRIDHGVFARELRADPRARLEFRQVGARDEARLVADYEKCGQHCCCKNFLKVLRPVSMKNAKIQKATLDPLKISGRCGRLMCCLRYEQETYDDLRKRLPRKKSRVGTPDGDGIVIDSQILTQLALIELDNGERVAIPIEELAAPGEAIPREKPAVPAMAQPRRERTRRPETRKPAPKSDTATPAVDTPREDGSAPAEAPKRKRRKRRRTRSEGDAATGAPPNDASPQTPSEPPTTESGPPAEASDAPGASDASDASDVGGGGGGSDKPRKRRRRRRRRTGGDGPSGNTDAGGSGGAGGESGGDGPGSSD
jgi:cell fate regulator YaaT (PSP1 superfamily)